MQATYESHQFYSPVTNWKSKNKNRRRQQILAESNQQKKTQLNGTKISKFPQNSGYSEKSVLRPTTPVTSRSTNDDLELPKRSQSLNKKLPIQNISPAATSKPITIPTSQKKITSSGSDFSSDQSMVTDLGLSSFSYGNHSMIVSTPNSKPDSTNASFMLRKNPSMGSIPKRIESSFNDLSKNKNTKVKVNLPRINTSNLSNISNSLDSCTLVDSAHTEFCPSSFNNSRKSLHSPKMAVNNTVADLSSGNITLVNISSSMNSSHDMIDHESSIATLVQSPTASDASFFSMSSDQLFRLLPKKIIRAIDSYTAQNKTTEISYKKGDFFFVISENDSYYFVTNPSTKQSGYVSKYSFEQVDHFSKSNVIKNNRKILSPVETKECPFLVKEQTAINDRIMTACITEDIITRNSQEKFPIEISKIDGTVALLYRSYNDICELHRSLLEYFPEDAGNSRQERILPFLPTLDAIFNHPSKSPREILSTYLQYLTKLPNYIQFSYPFDEFFNLRKDDIHSSIYVCSPLNFFENNKNHYHHRQQGHSTLKVKLIIEDDEKNHQEVSMIRVDPDIGYFDLFDMIEERFNKTFTNIYYQNETGARIKIFGEHDLNLFFNSNNLSYVLWAK
ncbi:hypothetical protein U3516DRAFT_892540 [Neocallimastix sp. 'constans']|jgi:hypothetical protein